MSNYQQGYGGQPPYNNNNPGYGPPGNPPAPGGYPPNAGFMNPTGPQNPPQSAPGGYNGYPPQGNPTTPPASNFPAYSAPGSSRPPAFSAPGGGPGNFNNAPAPAAPKSIQFFSPTGGAPVPAAVVSSVPSMGISGPPTGGGPPVGGPPVGGPPLTMAPPPSQFNGVPPPQYGAPPASPSQFQQGVPGQVLPPPAMGPPGPQGGFPGQPGAPNMMYGGAVAPGPYAAAPGYPQPQMPSGFGDSNPNSQQGAPNPNDPNGASQSGGPLPLIDEMDLSIQCNPQFMRSTVSKIVSSQSQATQSRIPLGLVVRPMCGDKANGNEDIEVVDFGSTGIVRCKRCRTYINPFVTWADNGRRWRCNICGMLNDVPSSYFSHLDSNGRRRDRDQRPELSKCSVEFVAPGDYMVRPPQPPVYFFVIDVSDAAIGNGMLHSLVNAIKTSLDELPGNPRTQIGFITFDQHIHFYNLKSSLKSPQMLVVSDVSDVIIPLPEDLLVNLADSRAVVDSLLDSLPTMFKASNSVQSCTGPALSAAKRVIQHLGGKLLLFQSSLPSIGEGSLKMRENPRLLGTDKEHTLLNAEEAWYKTNAIDFSRLQIAIDVFLFSSQYTDLATLSVLAKYSAGTCYYYPSYHAPRDGTKFERELHHDLTRATAFEAVMRVRATRGLRFSNFFGNYFVRGTDLLALPTCTTDSSFSLDIAYDEAMLSAQAITIQAALLYTSAAGERRIRVHTMVLPVTTSVTEMVDSLDIDCAMNLLSKQACDIACKTGLENARQRVHQTTVEILRASRGGGGGGGHPMGAHPGQYGGPQYGAPQAAALAPIPNSLLLLPLYSMSLQKSLVLRGGQDVRTDERAYFQHLLYNMDIEESKVFIYPRLFSIHDMGTDIGLPSDNADDDCPTAGPFQVRLPSILNLSYERLSSDGIFLMENGYDMFMWIGRNVNPSIISTLFGVHSLEGVDVTTMSIIAENSDYSSRVNAVIVALRDDRSRYMQLHFIKEGDNYAEAYFARYLIEDRANFPGGSQSYTEYHSTISRS